MLLKCKTGRSVAWALVLFFHLLFIVFSTLFFAFLFNEFRLISLHLCLIINILGVLLIVYLHAADIFLDWYDSGTFVFAFDLLEVLLDVFLYALSKLLLNLNFEVIYLVLLLYEGTHVLQLFQLVLQSKILNF